MSAPALQIPAAQRRCDQCDHYRDYYDGNRLCVAGHFSRLASYAVQAGEPCGPSRMLWRARQPKEVTPC